MKSEDVKKLIKLLEIKNISLKRYNGRCLSCNKKFIKSLFKYYCNIDCYETGLKKSIDKFFDKKLIQKRINK